MEPRLPAVHLLRDVGRETAARMVRAGTWVQARPGAFCETPVGESWKRRRHMALARAVAVSQQLPGVTLSRETAALVHGLQVWRVPEVTDVIQTTTPRAGLPRDVRRSVAMLAPDEVVEVEGVRVTALERTMLDGARYLHPRAALVVVDSGLRRLVLPKRGEDRRAVESRAEPLRAGLLARIAPRSRFAVQARAVVTWSDPLAESAPESSIRWVLVSRGMPRPMLQREVETDLGLKYTDLAWLRTDGRWLHVEFDGLVKYTDDPQGRTAARVLVDERQREAAITDLGDRVVRIYPSDLDDDLVVLRKITRHIPRKAIASWRPVPGLFRPPGG